MMHMCGAAAIAAAALSIASSAKAESKADEVPAVRPFGDPGMVVFEDVIGARTAVKAEPQVLPLGNDLALSAAWFSVASAKSEKGGPRRKWTTFAPSFDVFVAPRVSLGALIGFQMVTDADEEKEGIAVSVDPRLGLAVPLSPALALWPRVSVGGTMIQGHGRNTWLARVGADVPLVVSVSRHVNVDFGITLTYSTSLKDTSVSTVAAGARGGLSLVF